MNTLVSPAMAAGGPAPSRGIQASGVPAALSDEALARESEIAQRAIRQRKQLIIWLRVAVLVIEHDMGLVFRFARRITVMVEGQVLVEGPVAEVRADPRVREVYLGNR